MVPSVTLDAAGDAVVDGVVIEDALLDAEAAAMLALAASADGGGGGAGPTALPDTASGEPFVPVALGSLLLIAAGIGASAARRSEVRAR